MHVWILLFQSLSSYDTRLEQAVVEVALVDDRRKLKELEAVVGPVGLVVVSCTQMDGALRRLECWSI